MGNKTTRNGGAAEVGVVEERCVYESSLQGDVTVGAESKSRNVEVCSLMSYSGLNKEPKRKNSATFKPQVFRQVSTEVQHQYTCFNKEKCDFRVMTPLRLWPIMARSRQLRCLR